MWCSRPWVGRLIWTSTFLLLGYVAWGSVYLPESLWAPGHLNQVHSKITDCGQCHQPFVGVVVEKCAVCHTAGQFLDGSRPDVGRLHREVLSRSQTCLDCHIEHQGSLSSITINMGLTHNPHGDFIYKVTGTSTCSDCHQMNPSPTIQDPGLLNNIAVLSLKEEGDGIHRPGHFADCEQCHGRGSWEDNDDDDDGHEEEPKD